MLMPDADSDAIALAANDILADSRFTAEAKRMADAIGGYGGAAQAAAALEALAYPADAVGDRGVPAERAPQRIALE
jgi:hypothetical protein